MDFDLDFSPGAVVREEFVARCNAFCTPGNLFFILGNIRLMVVSLPDVFNAERVSNLRYVPGDLEQQASKTLSNWLDMPAEVSLFPPPFRINIMMLSGETITMDNMTWEMTVRYVKHMIEDLAAVAMPVDKQILIFDDKQLDDDMHLYSYNIQEETQLSFM